MDHPAGNPVPAPRAWGHPALPRGVGRHWPCGRAGTAPWTVFALCLVRGIAVIADSAQFSASIAELSEPGSVGTMLTAQTCAGFALTLLTIHLMPALVDAAG